MLCRYPQPAVIRLLVSLQAACPRTLETVRNSYFSHWNARFDDGLVTRLGARLTACCALNPISVPKHDGPYRCPARGLVLPAGDFYIDPWRPVDRRGDHARPFGPCTRRPSPTTWPRHRRRRAARPARRRRPGCRALWRTARAQWRAASACTLRATCWARRRCGWNMVARYGWHPVTTSCRRMAPAIHLSLYPVTSLLRNPPSGLPIYRWDDGHAVRADINACVGGQCGAGRTVGAVPLCLRQGAADPAWPGRVDRPHRDAWRGRNAQPRLSGIRRGPCRPPSRPPAPAIRRRCGARWSWRRLRRAAPPLDAPFRRSCRRLRQRLDALARRPAAARGRSGLRDVGSRGLARSGAGHRGHRRAAGDRHPRQRGRCWCGG